MRAFTVFMLSLCVTVSATATATATAVEPVVVTPTITLSEPVANAKRSDLRIMTASGICSIEISKEKLARRKETGLQYSGKIIQCDDLAGEARSKCDAANATARKAVPAFSR